MTQRLHSLENNKKYFSVKSKCGIRINSDSSTFPLGMNCQEFDLLALASKELFLCNAKSHRRYDTENQK
jgi:hypothetical protein